jgi:hypothetical protein
MVQGVNYSPFIEEISKEAVAVVEMPPVVIPMAVPSPISSGGGPCKLIFVFSICRAPSCLAKNPRGVFIDDFWSTRSPRSKGEGSVLRVGPRAT